jgi:RimJ/RimL family protein N-acetyltransferase
MTLRLVVRPWKADDLAGLQDMDTNPEVMRYISDGSVSTLEQVEGTLTRLMQPPPRPGLGLLAIEERATGAFLGWAGLSRPQFLPSVMPAVEAGWRLRRCAWGHGFATEAARAAMASLLPDLDLTEEGGALVSIRHVDNIASGRVMTKLGFTESHRAVVPGTGMPVVVYRASVDDLTLE